MPKSRNSVEQDPQSIEGSPVHINVYDLWENNKYAVRVTLPRGPTDS